MYGDEPSFSWIKFFVLTILFTIPMWIFAPSIKWKLLFTVAVPIGVYLALAGKSLNFHGRR